MKTIKECYNNLANLLAEHDEVVKIYRDISDGVYLNKMNTKNDDQLIEALELYLKESEKSIKNQVLHTAYCYGEFNVR